MRSITLAALYRLAAVLQNGDVDVILRLKIADFSLGC
jgi:hypothetical protein